MNSIWDALPDTVGLSHDSRLLDVADQLVVALAERISEN